MRTRSLLLAALVATFVLPARADEMSSYSVTIAEPRYALVSAPDLLVVRCGPHTEGCTKIVGTSFTGECVPQAGGWGMVPSVSLVPYIFIGVNSPISRTYVHEMTHIDDIERSMEGHVREIASARFQSLDQCREAMNLESTRIEEVTRRFAEESFELRR
ncbi:MAG TPA: hypothetical protein VLV78_20520 [Thermoanaerobaculia bacterium]|nr:hypothetical protein [Thermoanaerobaculia bacterium]